MILMGFEATSGSAATIASDALMNPFDGKSVARNCARIGRFC